MNPRAREVGPASLIVPDIASARPARSLRYSPRLSYKERSLQRALINVGFLTLVLPGIAGMVPRTVFGQTGPDQSNERAINPEGLEIPSPDLTLLDFGDTWHDQTSREEPRNLIPAIIEAPTDLINFYIQPGVDSQVAEIVQRGILLAQTWGSTNLGITGMRAVDVYVYAGDPGPNPMGNTEPDGRIIFYPRHYQWVQQTPRRLFSGMGHELAHHWQYSRSNLTSFRDEITWIVEGFADYIGFRIAVDQRFLTMEEMEGCFALYTKSSRPKPPPLSQIESRIQWDAAQGSGYWPAELAAHYLSTKYGTNTLITFFDQLPQAGNNWEQAFRVTFGQSLEDFYLEFDRYVTSLPLPGNNPCIDTGMIYQPGK